MLAAREGNSFEPRVCPERAHEVANVVADRVDAEVKRAGDLIGGLPVLQEMQHFELAASGSVRDGCLADLDARHLSEDSDHVVVALERHGAELDRDPLPVGVDDDALVLGTSGGPVRLRKKISRARRLLPARRRT